MEQVHIALTLLDMILTIFVIYRGRHLGHVEKKLQVDHSNSGIVPEGGGGYSGAGGRPKGYRGAHRAPGRKDDDINY